MHTNRMWMYMLLLVIADVLSASSSVFADDRGGAMLFEAPPQVDTPIPLEHYFPVTNDTQLMLLYFAISGPLSDNDYDEFATAFSAQYRSTTDVFRKKHILAEQKSRFDAELSTARWHRYFTMDEPSVVGPTVSHYDSAKKGFHYHLFDYQCSPIAPHGKEFCRNHFGYAYTNNTVFTTFVVSDEASARRIEALVSRGVPLSLRVYAVAEGVGSYNPKLATEHLLKSRIWAVKLLDPQGKELAFDAPNFVGSDGWIVPSYAPNGTLDRDFELRVRDGGTCVVAKGTAVWDLGLLPPSDAEGYDERMHEIALAPGLCPYLGPNHRWIMPDSVVSYLHASNSVPPAAAGNPRGPEPVASQTVYPMQTLIVRTQGVGGGNSPIICTVPANTPVPAHDLVALNIPGKSGVYAAESYKTDLCPNMSVSQAHGGLSSWDRSQSFSATLSPH